MIHTHSLFLSLSLFTCLPFVDCLCCSKVVAKYVLYNCVNVVGHILKKTFALLGFIDHQGTKVEPAKTWAAPLHLC